MLSTIPLTNDESWQDALINAVMDLPTLLKYLNLSPEQVSTSQEAMSTFPLRVPLPYLERIEPGNPRDPLLLQVLPLVEENLQIKGYCNDPLQELRFNPHPGLLQKYHGRALILATGTCAVHCRYCFRRHFPYAENNPGRERWMETLESLRTDTTINEIILSGGDPLAMADKQLRWLVKAVESLPQIRRIRIHTRLPIMIPQRINHELCSLLAETGPDCVVVVHSNHPQEFDNKVDSACQRLKESGVTLLNQSVLLKGINDNTETLKSLSERLFSAGVLPYYLHLLDKTHGTAHFDVSASKARELLHQLRESLPGYLVPKLVSEIPGESSKTPVF